MKEANVVPAFYGSPGAMTDFGSMAEYVNDLPADALTLCQIVQGIAFHVFWAQPIGYEISASQSSDAGLRSVERMLEQLLTRNNADLRAPREIPDRLAIDCRSFAVLLAAFLIHRGTPARARCGFARYLVPPHIEFHEDHWITEYWNADENRWAFADAQLDSFQRQAMGIVFDPCDVPQELFFPAGRAWISCRRGEMDPQQFGFDSWVGFPIIRWQMIRDIAALNKVEAWGWDHWGGMFPVDHEELSEDNLSFYDHAAQLSMDDMFFPELRRLYLKDLRLRAPRIVHQMRPDSDENEFEYSDLLDEQPDKLVLL